MHLPDFYLDDLSRLDETGRRRALVPRTGKDFSSDDYLAFANSEELRKIAAAALARGVALGSGGSRPLRGNTQEHEALEAEAAKLFGSSSALFVGSGFAANSLIFGTLPQQGDLILHDALVHASAHEGMKLSRASLIAFPHNDVDAAASVIARWRENGGRGTPWIAFETLYSMDGDTAPVADFAALAEHEGAMLLIDEAHAVGVCGTQAAQWHGRENAVLLATCGKALGCEGALIFAPTTIRDFLVNRGRSFIFATAPSALMTAIVRGALVLAGAANDRRERLRKLVRRTTEILEPVGIVSTGTHIQPLIVGGDARAMTLASALQSRGFDVRGIRPPSVPRGTARLRISITLNTAEAAIAALGNELENLL